MALKLFNVFFSPRDQKVLLTWVESHPDKKKKGTVMTIFVMITLIFKRVARGSAPT